MDNEQNAPAGAETIPKAGDRPAIAPTKLATCGRSDEHLAHATCDGIPRPVAHLPALIEPAGAGETSLVPGGCPDCGRVHPGMDCAPADQPPSEPAAPADELGSYTAMMDEYLREQRHWIGPAQQPLVFHMRKLCQKLDANPDAPASLSSAYLQAFRRLDLQRPGNTQPAGAAGDLPGQGTIFDELDA